MEMAAQVAKEAEYSVTASFPLDEFKKMTYRMSRRGTHCRTLFLTRKSAKKVPNLCTAVFQMKKHIESNSTK